MSTVLHFWIVFVFSHMFTHLTNGCNNECRDQPLHECEISDCERKMLVQMPKLFDTLQPSLWLQPNFVCPSRVHAVTFVSDCTQLCQKPRQQPSHWYYSGEYWKFEPIDNFVSAIDIFQLNSKVEENHNDMRVVLWWCKGQVDKLIERLSCTILTMLRASHTPGDHLRQKYKISFLCLSYLCVISCQAHSSELPQWYYTGQSWKPGKFKNAVRMIVVSQLLGQSFGGEVKRTVLFEIETVIVWARSWFRFINWTSINDFEINYHTRNI